MKKFALPVLLLIFISINFSCGSSDPTGGVTLASIAITPANPSIAVGGTVQFIATGTYTDGRTSSLTSDVTWSSSNASVATIKSGLVVGGIAAGVAAGSTNISAAVLGISSNSTAFTVAPSGGTFVATWGTRGIGNGEFSTPVGIALDLVGNVYVSDSGNNRIQKFDSNGNFLSQWGSVGAGNGQFNDPENMAIDVSDNVYVVDRGNNRIQKFDSNGVFLAQWNANASYHPLTIGVNPADTLLYIITVNNFDIQEFTVGGVYTGTHWGAYGTGDGQFGGESVGNAPEGIDFASGGNVYVSDTFNNRIQVLMPDGTFVSKWGIQGAGNGEFNSPSGIAIDASNNVYVIDQLNCRIQKFDSIGTYISQFGSCGSGEMQFIAPTNLAVDGSGNIYVVDSQNARIQKISQ